jgi:hypothetical protein
MKRHFKVFIKTAGDLAHNKQFTKLTQIIHKDQEQVTTIRKNISDLIL